MRRGALWSLAAPLLGGALLSPAPAHAQDRVDLPTLAAGERVERDIAGQVHAFGVEARAGDFLRIAVEQRGIDLVVEVRGPAGEKVLEVDAAPGPRGVETLAWLAQTTGVHRIEIGPPDEHRTSGSYTLWLEARRIPTAADGDVAAAERLLSDGLRLLAEAKAESRKKALETLQAALPLWRAAGERKKEAATLLALGQTAAALSDPIRATAWADEAAALARAEGDRALETAALDGAAAALFAQGFNEKARDKFEAVLGAWRELGHVPGEAVALADLAVVDQALWDHQRAVDGYQEAIELFHVLGDRKREARTLSNLALAHHFFGDDEKAIELLHQVLPLRREFADRRGEAIVLTNLGLAYAALADTGKALDYYKAALPIFREIGDRGQEAITLNNIANALAQENDVEGARTAYAEALELRRAVGDKAGETYVLKSLAEMEYKAGHHARARELADQALVLARATGNRYLEATALLQIAMLKARAGDLEGAREQCLEAMAVGRTVQAPKLHAFSAYRLAWIERARGDLQAARTRVEEALAIIESLRTRLSSADFRAAYVATMREIYEFHVDLLMQLHAKDPAKGFDALAFQAAERARSRSLLDLLTESRADIREGVAAELLARERSLRGRLNVAAERRLRPSANQPAEAASALDREIERLTSELGKAEAEIRATSPRYAALTQPAVLSPSRVQAEIGKDTLLLEYSLGEERSFLWALSHDSLSSHVLPPRATIEAAARRAHRALSQRGDDGEAAVAELSRILLEPVAERLGRVRVVVVADGALLYVPFAALTRPGTRQPLIDRHEVVGLPSASTLPLLRQEQPGRRRATKTLVVLADPVFGADDERVRSTGPSTPVSSTSLTRAAGDLGLSGSLPRLPYTRREARAIAGALPRARARVALDFEASQDTVADPDLERYRFVHFATHGLLNSAHPELSGLVFSLVDSKGRPQDGFLTTAAIFNLRLSADLVVLSGCRTALGKEIRGEGLVGMTRAFMYAGAPRVLASLWAVDDVATAQLMTSLYRRLLAGGSSPAAALRRAQLSLKKEARFRHPYYWAGFQLQGEWR